MAIHAQFEFNHVFFCFYEKAFIHFPIGSYVNYCHGDNKGFLIATKNPYLS